MAILTASVLLLPAGAQAEIIVDDFDDPFEIILPEMNGQYVQQFGVGPLGANRYSRLYASSGFPIGRANAHLSRPSALTFEVERLNPPPSGALPVVGITLGYSFDEIDITQNGLNDRAVLDFSYLQSAVPMARVDVFIWDMSQPSITHVSQLFGIPLQDEPFRLEFPFDSFGVRGGGTGQIDYTRVYSVSVSIYPVYFSGPDAIDFSMAMERIRFTHAIPEPRTGVLACFAALAAILFAVRRRRVELCRSGPVCSSQERWLLP